MKMMLSQPCSLIAEVEMVLSQPCPLIGQVEMILRPRIFLSCRSNSDLASSIGSLPQPREGEMEEKWKRDFRHALH